MACMHLMDCCCCCCCQEERFNSPTIRSHSLRCGEELDAGLVRCDVQLITSSPELAALRPQQHSVESTITTTGLNARRPGHLSHLKELSPECLSRTKCEPLAGMAGPNASDTKDNAATNFPKRYWLDIVVLGGMLLVTWFLIQFL